jgi:hypothetical protein
MTKEEARGVIENFLNEMPYVKLPIFDEFIKTEYNEELSIFGGYSFRELLKVAYDLTEKNTN